jgi:CheY-like chemotaxis protein
VATVSHELHTPLNAVLGWARLLRLGKLDPAAAARGVETIERSAQAQAQIVDDLLDMSRIVRGELRLDVLSVELVPVIEAALDGDDERARHGGGDRSGLPLLLSDLGMPGEDGLALIRKVRSLEPARGGHVPAAALTAYTQAEDRSEALLAGFQLYLAKPVEPAELTLAVARLAGRMN